MSRSSFLAGFCWFLQVFRPFLAEKQPISRVLGVSSFCPRVPCPDQLGSSQTPGSTPPEPPSWILPSFYVVVVSGLKFG